VLFFLFLYIFYSNFPTPYPKEFLMDHLTSALVGLVICLLIVILLQQRTIRRNKRHLPNPNKEISEIDNIKDEEMQKLVVRFSPDLYEKIRVKATLSVSQSMNTWIVSALKKELANLDVETLRQAMDGTKQDYEAGTDPYEITKRISLVEDALKLWGQTQEGAGTVGKSSESWNQKTSFEAEAEADDPSASLEYPEENETADVSNTLSTSEQIIAAGGAAGTVVQFFYSAYHLTDMAKEIISGGGVAGGVFKRFCIDVHNGLSTDHAIEGITNRVNNYEYIERRGGRFEDEDDVESAFERVPPELITDTINQLGPEDRRHLYYLFDFLSGEQKAGQLRYYKVKNDTEILKKTLEGNESAPDIGASGGSPSTTTDESLDHQGQQVSDLPDAQSKAYWSRRLVEIDANLKRLRDQPLKKPSIS